MSLRVLTLIVFLTSLSIAATSNQKSDLPWYLDNINLDSTPSMHRCQQEGQMLRDHKNIPQACINRAFAEASPRQYRETKNFFVLGKGNLIFIREKKLVKEGRVVTEEIQKRIISGSYSMIHDIQAVFLNENGSEIAILDRKDDYRILIFSSQRNGNVVPLRVIEHESLGDITSIAFISALDELALGNLKDNSIDFVPLTIDTRSKRSKDAFVVKRRYKGDTTKLLSIDDLSYSPSKKKLFVLDRKGNQISGFLPDSSGSPESIIRNLSSKILNPLKLRIDADKTSISIYGSSGNLVEIPY